MQENRRKLITALLIAILLLLITAAIYAFVNRADKPIMTTVYDPKTERITISIKNTDWPEDADDNRYYIAVWRDHATEMMPSRMDYYPAAGSGDWLIYVIDGQNFLESEQVTVTVQALSSSGWFTQKSKTAYWNFTAG